MKNNIKNILKEKGLSIRKFAMGLDKDYAYVYNLVNRDSLESIQLNTLVEIAEFLEVDITDLYG